MSAVSAETQQDTNEEFQTSEIATILGGHFTHDMFSAWLTPLLPLLKERLSTGFAATGSLAIFIQIPTLLTPFIGYLADRVSLRYFIILAPAITGTLMSLMGFTTSYVMLAMLLFATGFSVAAFHAPAPAMIGRVSGNRVGLGMSVYMASGELGRALGPLIVVAGVDWFGLTGLWRLALFGWAVSIVLWYRLRNISARPTSKFQPKFREMLPKMREVFPALTWLMTMRVFMMIALTTYLPLYMTSETDVSLWVAAQSLTILEIAGVAGAMVSGTMSDRFGRNRVLLALMIAGPIMMLLFINVSGVMLVPVLLILGFVIIATTPVYLAMVQDNFPDNRAFANGIFMMLNFIVRAFGIWLVGTMADSLGLQTAYFITAALAVLSIPAIWFLPKEKVSLA